MPRIVLRAVAVAAILASLSACSANRNAIFRHQPIAGDPAAVTVIDAKQRVILSAKKTISVANSSTTHGRQFCTEPSPDVFAVLAQALSAGGSFGKSVDPKAIEVALTGAFSSSEQGSTIPRTQTINMLRELMFRTCERYLNGGIGEFELPLQAIRDQRLMVSILAIEQLTGAVTPKPIVIGASGEAAAGASSAEAAVRLDDAYKDLQAKTTAQQKRQNEFNEISTESKDCDQIAEAVANGNEDKLSDAHKAKRAQCESAASALAKAKTERADAAAHYAMLNDVASSGGIPVSTGTTLMQPTADGGIDQARSEAISDVADTVLEIVELNFKQDEFGFLCLKVLSPGMDLTKLQPIAQACMDYLTSGLELEKQRNLKSAEELAAEMAVARLHQGQVVETLFDSFWKNVSSDGIRADANKIAQLKSRFASWPECFAENGTKIAYHTCFGGLTAQEQRNLAQ